MEDILLQENPELKLYAEGAISLGTFFGGPLAAGYLISENFKALGQPDKVKPTWLIAIGSTVLTFAAVYLIPNFDKVPNFLFPVVYILIAKQLVKKYQSTSINSHVENGGQLWSLWRAVGVGLIGAIVLFAIIAGVILLFNN